MDQEAIRQRVYDKLVSDYVELSRDGRDADWVSFDEVRTGDCLQAVYALLRSHKGEEARLLALELIDGLIFRTAKRHANIVMENRGAELIAEWGKDED